MPCSGLTRTTHATSAPSQARWSTASLFRRQRATTLGTAACSRNFRASGSRGVLALGSRTLVLCMTTESTLVARRRRLICLRPRYGTIQMEMDGQCSLDTILGWWLASWRENWSSFPVWAVGGM